MKEGHNYKSYRNKKDYKLILWTTAKRYIICNEMEKFLKRHKLPKQTQENGKWTHVLQEINLVIKQIISPKEI